MARVKVRMNGAGARALLNSPEVVADLGARAEAMADAACAAVPDHENKDSKYESPFRASASAGHGRARASVFAASQHGKNHDAKHNTLLKSLGAGR